MKKVLAILFIIVYAFGATEACEILKLPMLIEHYHQHKAEQNGSLSLIDFLVMHYNGKDSADSGHHQQLPFKAAENHVSFAAVAVPPYYCFQSKEKVSFKISYPVFKRNFYSSLLEKGIFQPPRLA